MRNDSPQVSYVNAAIVENSHAQSVAKIGGGVQCLRQEKQVCGVGWVCRVREAACWPNYGCNKNVELRWQFGQNRPRNAIRARPVTSEAALIVDWYNEHRTHETLRGKTPNEVYYAHPAANEQPRLEPRPGWPPDWLCAKPQVEIDGQPGDPILVEIDCLEERTHLPVIRAQHAA